MPPTHQPVNKYIMTYSQNFIIPIIPVPCRAVIMCIGYWIIMSQRKIKITETRGLGIISRFPNLTIT
jgi:hypothetical protein